MKMGRRVVRLTVIKIYVLFVVGATLVYTHKSIVSQKMSKVKSLFLKNSAKNREISNAFFLDGEDVKSGGFYALRQKRRAKTGKTQRKAQKTKKVSFKRFSF